MSEKPTPEEVADFAVNFICELFEVNENEKGVLHKTLTLRGTKSLVEQFSLKSPEEGTYPAERLFSAAYEMFSREYGIRESLPKNGNPGKMELYWKLKMGMPDRKEFADRILDKSRSYLESNLEQCVVKD